MSSSSETDPELEDFQVDKAKKKKKLLKAKQKNAKKQHKKKIEKPFQPIIRKTKTKQSGDNYRRRKKTLIKNTYKLINKNQISVALVVAGQQFSKGIQVAGEGYTLDELSKDLLHFTNYEPDDSDQNEDKSVQELLKEAKKRVFNNTPVSISNLNEVDDFLKNAVAKVLGVEQKNRGEEPNTGVPEDEGGSSQDQHAKMDSSEKTKKALRIVNFTKKLYKFCGDMNSSATAIIGSEDGSSSIKVIGAGFTLGCVSKKKQIHNLTYVAPVTQEKYAPGLEVMRALKMSESIEPAVEKVTKKKKKGDDVVRIEEEIQIVEERSVPENVTAGLEKRNKLKRKKTAAKKDLFDKKMPPAGTIKRRNIFDKEATKSSPFAL